MSIQIVQGSDCNPKHADITIINYDVVARHETTLRAVAWDAIIIDEMHYLKNVEAKRTKAIVGHPAKKPTAQKPAIEAKPGIAGRRILGLTGTPIPNRPIEGWPIFHYLAPGEFNSFWSYARRFCGASESAYGWDLTGSSNLGDLQEKLRASCMVRRLKKDVLKELPAKRRAVIELAANGASSFIAAEREAWDRKEALLCELRVAVELAKASDDPADYTEAVRNLKEAARVAFTEIARLRHDTAVAKIPYVVEHIHNVIEDGSKVVVFAHHHDVIKALREEFGPKAVAVYGEIAMAERQQAVDLFQDDPHVQIFIGGILAAGVGLTLTAASHVVFAELDWVPGNVTQAEDRCHRIGQIEMVLVEHLVLEGSLDARMASILVEKQEVIDMALDREVSPALPTKERAATESTTRAKLEADAKTLTAKQITAVHQGLAILAAMDTDRARDLNGMGFSKVDTDIGCSLARCGNLTPKQAALGLRLVTKYRRQLPAGLVDAAKGAA